MIEWVSRMTYHRYLDARACSEQADQNPVVRTLSVKHARREQRARDDEEHRLNRERDGEPNSSTGSRDPCDDTGKESGDEKREE